MKKTRQAARITSIDDMVSAALNILDQEGLEALSMRGLAKAMGVGPMTLYNYLESKDELLGIVATRVLADLAMHIDPSAHWRSRLRDALAQFHERLMEHPWLCRMLIDRSRYRPLVALDPMREIILVAMADGGFSTSEAVEASTALVAFVIGFRSIERTRTRQRSIEEQDRLRMLDPKRFPALIAAAPYFEMGHPTHAFHIGLESLIDGLTPRLGAS